MLIAKCYDDDPLCIVCYLQTSLVNSFQKFANPHQSRCDIYGLSTLPLINSFVNFYCKIVISVTYTSYITFSWLEYTT